MELGLRYYATQQYEQAAEAFRRAYVAEPKPETLYALAQSLRLSGDCEGAEQAYLAFLRTGPDERRAQAVHVNMKRCVPAKKAPPNVASTPSAAPTKTPPTEPPPSQQPRSPWYTDTAGGFLTLSGIAGLSVAAVFLVVENGNESDMKAADTYETYDSSLTAANRSRKISLVAGSVGAALLIGGVIRYLTFSDETPSSEVSASIGDHAGGVTWSGTF